MLVALAGLPRSEGSINLLSTKRESAPTPNRKSKHIRYLKEMSHCELFLGAFINSRYFVINIWSFTYQLFPNENKQTHTFQKLPMEFLFVDGWLQDFGKNSHDCPWIPTEILIASWLVEGFGFSTRIQLLPRDGNSSFSSLQFDSVLGTNRFQSYS